MNLQVAISFLAAALAGITAAALCPSSWHVAVFLSSVGTIAVLAAVAGGGFTEHNSKLAAFEILALLLLGVGRTGNKVSSGRYAHYLLLALMFTVTFSLALMVIAHAAGAA